MTQLGSGLFGPPAVLPAVIPSQDDATGVRLELVLAALENLRESLDNLPVPQVFVDAPDLTAIVTAVNGLKPGADADQIAEAVVRTLAPTATPAETNDWQGRLIDSLEKLDFRLKGVGSSGSGLVSDIGDRPDRQLGIVTVSGGGVGGSTGGLTNTELRATPVPVSGTVSTTGTVSVSNFPATQPVSIASTVPVSGTFWQTTQPVSLASNTPDVTDRAARLLGHVTVDNASIPVTGTFFQGTQPVSIAATVTTADSRLPSALNVDGGLPTHVQNFPATTAVTGTFFQATQPVSLATNTPDVTDRAARLLGHVTVDSAPTTAVTGTFFQATQPVSLATNTPTLAAGTNTVGNLNEIRAATTYATIVSSAVSLGATLTLAAPGAGLFHYITSIEITNYTGIARTGAATPITVTTTNITGSPAYTFATAAAIGTTDIQRPILATPLKVAAANTATTIVAPVVTGSFWRINVTYFVAA